MKYRINTIPIGELGGQEYWFVEKYGSRMILVRNVKSHFTKLHHTPNSIHRNANIDAFHLCVNLRLIKPIDELCSNLIILFFEKEVSICCWYRLYMSLFAGRVTGRVTRTMVWYSSLVTQRIHIERSISSQDDCDVIFSHDKYFIYYLKHYLFPLKINPLRMTERCAGNPLSGLVGTDKMQSIKKQLHLQWPQVISYYQGIDTKSMTHDVTQ